MNVMSGRATFPKIALECVQITPDKVIVATAERVWVYQPSSTSDADGIAPSSSRPQQVTATQKLLDTSIVLAKRAVSSHPQTPMLTPLHWIWQLASQYHMCHVTPPLMKAAAERFAATGRELLAQWAAHKAIEEQGHDRLALRDIQALGYKAEAVVETLVPPSATALVDYFTRSVQAPDPIGCVGYAYALERLATAVDGEHIQAVEAQLPPNVRATRCLRVHSGIGSDIEHVNEIIELVAELTPQERTQVAIACYETALLYFSLSQEDEPSDEKLQQWLKPLASCPKS